MQTLGDSQSRFLFDYNPIHSREPIVWALWLWVDCWYPSRVHHTCHQEASFFWDTDYSYLFPVGDLTPTWDTQLPAPITKRKVRWRSSESRYHQAALTCSPTEPATPDSLGHPVGSLAWALLSDASALGLAPTFCLTTWLGNLLLTRN